MTDIRQWNPIYRNKWAFFTLEAMLGMLMLVFALSWVITVVMNTQVLQDAIRQQDVAMVHARYVVSGLQGVPEPSLVEEIRDGLWNYPNAPSIAAVGMIPLPGESIITEFVSGGEPKVVVTVRWFNRHDEVRTETTEMMLGQK